MFTYKLLLKNSSFLHFRNFALSNVFYIELFFKKRSIESKNGLYFETYQLNLFFYIRFKWNNLTYQFFDRNLKNSNKFLHISWSLHIFCRVCCLAHSSHNGSGSSHVLQKCVALTWIFSIKHGSHSTSLSCWLFSLNHNENTTFKTYLNLNNV